jgi:hypothetical protein
MSIALVRAPVNRVAYRISALLLASGLFHLAVFAVDGGPWEGPVSWRKPVTFGLSFGLTLASVVWVSSLLTMRARTRTALLGLFTTASVLEVALISLQAWRGVPSHFNVETTFDSTVTRLLAAGGGLIFIAVIGLTITALRRDAGLPPSMRLSIRIGFVTLLVALLFGAAMIAKGSNLLAQGQVQTAYATAGTFKPAHAVAMHGVLLLPGLARLLSFTTWDEDRRTRVIALAGTGYALLVAAAAVLF